MTDTWRYWCPYCGEPMYYSSLYDAWFCPECGQSMTTQEILKYIQVSEQMREYKEG